MSRGSTEKMASTASANSVWASVCVMFCSDHVCAVIESSSAALGAFQGASSGTVWASWSIFGSVTSPSSTTAAGLLSGGIVPV